MRSVFLNSLDRSLIGFDRYRIKGYTRRRTRWEKADKYTGKRISASEIRPFLFAPIALTDDASEAVRDEAIIKGLGTIRLDFYRVVHQGRSERKESYADNSKQQVSLHGVGWKTCSSGS